VQTKLIHDDLTSRQFYVTADRVSRPQATTADCPFCPGGLESRGIDGPYAFANRWPPVENDRCPPLLENSPPGSACPACVEGDPDLRIEKSGGWVATVPAASPAPYCLRLMSSHHVPALSSLDETSRNGLAQDADP